MVAKAGSKHIKEKLVYGQGVSTIGKYNKTYQDSDGVTKHTKEYSLWKNMLGRCYSEAYLTRRPTYCGCTVSENFKNFQWFAEWCNSQVGFGLEDSHLDKDLLVKGNKVYSEDTCLFVPRAINSFMCKSEKVRGDLPIGVQYNKKLKMFSAQAKDADGTCRHLGSSLSVEDTFRIYKAFKKNIANIFAERYKNVLDSRAYEALLNYEICIDD